VPESHCHAQPRYSHMLKLLSILTAHVSSGLLVQWTDLMDKSILT
jgi:hypothetical protein